MRSVELDIVHSIARIPGAKGRKKEYNDAIIVARSQQNLQIYVSSLCLGVEPGSFRADMYINEYIKVMPGFRVSMFGSSPFPVPAAEVERGMSCVY